MTLWEGRMGERPADALMAFTASVSFDRRLAVDDIAGSRAHVRGLKRAGVLTEQEVGIMLAALNRVEDELGDGSFRFLPSDEDIHTAIERRVSEIAGPAGGKLHTGRSRNDQVATAVRLFTKRQLTEVARGVVALQEVLYERARTAPDAYATGSSMLPQKKNPDVAELARGKAGRLIGHLSGFLATLKGLPFAYNRDLQEDKEPLFDAVDQTQLALSALSGLMASARFNVERMAEAADSPAAAAIDLAEYLVEKGVPFRHAHGIVAALVRDSLERHLPLAELVQAHPDLGSEAVALLEPGVPVTRRTSPGAAGPEAVADQLRRFRERPFVDEERLGHD